MGKKHTSAAYRHFSIEGKSCHYCGAAPATTRDHVVPFSLGGRADGNLVAACRPCNDEKADQVWDNHCAQCRTIWWHFRKKGKSSWKRTKVAS